MVKNQDRQNLFNFALWDIQLTKNSKKLFLAKNR
jgi:hypothetical protein